VLAQRDVAPERSLRVVEDTRIGAELVPKAKCAQVLSRQPRDVILQYADGFRTVLFLVAHHDNALRK
jgi:hypothetical protein